MGQPMGTPHQAPAGANPAQTAGIIMLVCALALAIGTFTKSWLSESGDGREAGIGLTGIKMCGRGECMALSWGDLDKMGGGKVPGDIKLFGYLGFLAGLASIGAAGAAGGLALSRNTHKIPTKVLLGIFGAASFSMAFFLVRVMTHDKLGDAGISYSGFLAFGGLIGASVVLKQMLGPIIARGQLAAGPAAYAQGPMGGAPMAAGAPPVACPRCAGQAGYVAQYQRHFCTACQQYV